MLQIIILIMLITMLQIIKYLFISENFENVGT